MNIDTLLLLSKVLSLGGLGLLIVSSIVGVSMASRTVQKLQVSKAHPKLAKFINGKSFKCHRLGALIGTLLLLLHPLPLLFTTSRTGITLTNALLPFIAPKENLWMGLGILAFYALLIVAGSSYFIKYFRRWVWRWLHYGIYAVFGLGLIHSLYISPDYLSGWVLDYFDGEKLIVVIMVAITVLFLLWRIFMLQRPNAQRKPTQAQQQRRSATALVQVPVENQG